MIREKARKLLEQLKAGEGLTTLFNESYYDEEMIKIIKVITNECKAKIKDEKGNEIQYGSDININLVEDIVKQLISSNNIIKNTIIRELTKDNKFGFPRNNTINRSKEVH